MTALAMAPVLGRRSATVRGVMDHRDERISGIDLKAPAFTGLA